jgi:hypothetical protein
LLTSRVVVAAIVCAGEGLLARCRNAQWQWARVLFGERAE